MARFFVIAAWIMLVVGTIAAGVVAIIGFVALLQPTGTNQVQSSGTDQTQGLLALIVAFAVLFVTLTNYAFLRLAGLIAAYISERS